MTIVGLIDLVSFVALAVALACIARNWRRGVSTDSMLLLLAVAIVSLIHATSNVLEWSGITAAFDRYEDYFQTIEPILWFFLVDSFRRARETSKLSESEERYRALYEDLPDAVFLADADSGIILDANQAAASLLARPVGEIVGLHQEEIHPPDASGSPERIFRAQLSESEGVGHAEARPHSVIRSDGELIPVEISARLVSLSGRPVMQGVFRDTSPHQKAADLLRKEKERAQKYLDIAGVAIVALDRDGRITMINQRGLEIFEYDHEHELLGKDWFETCIPNSLTSIARDTYLSQIMTGKRVSRESSEGPIVTRSGKQRIIAWHNIVLRDDDGAISGSLSSGQDITEQCIAERERKELESQLRHAQKLESIGTLASGVAHEINNPLTSIINYAQLIHDRTESDSFRKFAGGIVEEGNRVAHIVKSLLAFSRHENEQPSLASMSDLINSALSIIESVLRKDQIQLAIEIAPDLPLLECRPQRIQQVLMNLLTNARDALNDRYPEFDENKTLRITVDLVEREERSWIRTIIEDHGRGIPSELVERIFDPFFSTKPRDKGTGLGLSISYGLVREHDGELLVESEPDAYTRFIMNLPVGHGRPLGE